MRWWFKCDAGPIFLAYAKSNVWSRAARRAREKTDKNQKAKRHANENAKSDKDKSTEDEDPAVDPDRGDYEDEDEDDDEDPALAIIIRIEGASGNDEGHAIHVRWLRGSDSVLFESFRGMLKRQMTTWKKT